MGKRNPNGYGCVTKLKGNRSRPWCVKVTVYDEEGHARQKPVGYAETEEQANILLAEYNNNPWDIDREKITLAVLYQRWAKLKLPKLGTANQSALKAAFKHCSKYYGIKYRSLRSYQMQDCIDNCGCGYATQGAIKNLWGHLDKFAFEIDLIDKMYSQLTTTSPTPETKRTPFTSEQVDALWKIKDEPWVNSVLIFIYTGFRLQELLEMKTDFFIVRILPKPLCLCFQTVSLCLSRCRNTGIYVTFLSQIFTSFRLPIVIRLPYIKYIGITSLRQLAERPKKLPQNPPSPMRFP